jgi:hypothetical protein
VLQIRQRHRRRVRKLPSVRSKQRICWTAGVIFRIYVTRTSCYCMIRGAIECFQKETYERWLSNARRKEGVSLSHAHWQVISFSASMVLLCTAHTHPATPGRSAYESGGPDRHMIKDPAFRSWSCLSSTLFVGALRGREQVGWSFQAVEARCGVRLSEKYHHAENQIGRPLLHCSRMNRRKMIWHGPGLYHSQGCC